MHDWEEDSSCEDAINFDKEGIEIMLFPIFLLVLIELLFSSLYSPFSLSNHLDISLYNFLICEPLGMEIAL
jgi:hypothetical protein